MSSGDRRSSAGGHWLCGLLAGFSLAATSACANSEAGNRIAAKAAEVAPEQVVRRIEPAPVAPAAAPSGTTPPPGTVAAGAGAPASAVASAAGTDPAAGKTSGAAANAEPITSKHLEAELNRLEAELR